MRMFLTILGCLLASAPAALPCDIVPWPHKHGLQAINLVSQRMDVRIRDQVAQVTIDATFHNPNAVVVEGIYFTNLPGDAHVDRLSMTVNGKEFQAELLDAEKARRIYRQIVMARRDPALLELVGGKMIKVSLYPIQPRSDVRVKISYSQILRMEGGAVRFQAPFAHNVTNDRAIRQAVFTVSIESKTPIKNVYSPTHNIDVAKRDDRHVRASYEAKNYQARKDLVLYYSLSEDEIGLTLLTHRSSSEDGYFALLLSPKVRVDPGKVLPKDLIFVTDRSGSMSGDKMRQAKEALLTCLDRLAPADRFTIVDFASEARTFEDKLVEAGRDQIVRAKKYVNGLRAAGSTNIDEALTIALGLLSSDPRRVPMIFFLTDGLPTVGEQDMPKILANVSAKKSGAAGRCRIFVFGVGHDVNTLFLDRLAEENRGAREYVQPEEKIDERVGSLYTKVAHPVLSGVTLDFGGVKTSGLYPRRMPDLFRGGQVVLFGRYAASGTVTITVRGTAAREEKVFRYPVSFPERSEEIEALPRLWAGRKVAYLVDQMRLSGKHDKEVIDEIIFLGKKYGIVTPYTSFLITEEDRGQFGRRAEEGLRLGFREARKSGGGNTRDALRSQADSKKLDKAKDAPSSDSLEKETHRVLQAARRRGAKLAVDRVAYVGAKVFYLKNGIWTDGAYAATPKARRKILFLSEDYFRLLEAEPGIARYLAVGPRVILVWKGAVLEISSGP